jgi:predicted anti-sigma-YlaC factor YlaD
VTNLTVRNDHARARSLIALAGPEALSLPDQTWLSAHMESCGSCRAFADHARAAVYAMRAIPIAAERGLVSTTQMMVRQRALELQRQRERLWMVSISCIAVTIFALVSAFVLWRGFEWLGERANLVPAVWQVGFVVFCLMPALIVGILLLARDVHLAAHTGSYQG